MMGAFAALLLYAHFFAAADEVSKRRAYRVIRRNVASFAYVNDYMDIIMDGEA